MPSSRPKARFNDIIFNIERIMAYLQGFTFETFVDDPRTVDAVERCMQRITEAAQAPASSGRVAACPGLGRDARLW